MTQTPSPRSLSASAQKKRHGPQTKRSAPSKKKIPSPSLLFFSPLSRPSAPASTPTDWPTAKTGPIT
ncbi:b7 [miniopterid betaherpesvirus 1]|uniref:B7 n=1 Tax=miniopterid betaherpesvirus 1 TaxID=3070189 RepID=I3VPY8_9BETA|nr:b7 [miniopterid betaherpesvirus 1]AFK83832.1 b7 [miniopterid betaherpesvirus 1]